MLESRPQAKDPADANFVFLTRAGRPYIRLQVAKHDSAEGITEEMIRSPVTTWNDAISRETGKLLRSLGIHRPGLNFYSLRRTFRTIADEAGDQPATMFIMGHADSDTDMSATYRQYLADDRLVKVTNHVREWLFGTVEA